MFDDYKKYISKFNIETTEVSDGSMAMEHEEKLNYISNLAKEFTVLSEVGSKQKGVLIPVDKWSKMMSNELEAGSWKVIAEARESGTVGIYNNDGTANEELIDNISKKVNNDNILWEAPIGKQQVWFIKLFGANVNLGNIAYADVIPLECLRTGLRGDTFFSFLPTELQKYKPS
jgi:phosphosulfolactate synthase